MRYTYLKYAVGVAIQIAMMCSCSEMLPGDDLIDSTGDATAGFGEVVIAVAELSEPHVATRVVIDESATPDNSAGLPAEWSAGDSFSMWAIGTDGNEYRNMRFNYIGREKYPLGDEAQPMFRCSSFPLMADGDYTYRAYYPFKELETDEEGKTISTEITYKIPSEQSGRYESSLDIMHAVAERSERLYLNTYNNDMGLTFAHDTHMLRIVMPRNPYESFGTTVGKVRITFPTNVAGTLTFDAATGAGPVFAGESNVIMVDFGGEGLQFDEETGESEPFWIFTPAMDIVGDVTFETSDTSGMEFTFPGATDQIDFSVAGQITPVNLSMPLREQIDDVIINVERPNLGELVTVLHSFTLPTGCPFPNADLSETADASNFEYVADGRFRVKRMFLDVMNKLSSGDEARLTVESKSVNPVDGTSAMAVSGREITVKSPYLFFEDFSGVNSFSSNDEYTGTFNSGSKDSYSFLNGWSGARIGAQAGKSIRIACRRETVADYGARVDSAPISALKEGATVKVNVSFDYGMAYQGRNVYQTVYLGYLKSSENLNSGSTTGTYPTNFTYQKNTGSYDITPDSKSYEIPDCDNQTRLSWRTMPEHIRISVDNSTLWLYIDNIKVSIVE